MNRYEEELKKQRARYAALTPEQREEIRWKGRENTARKRREIDSGELESPEARRERLREWRERTIRE